MTVKYSADPSVIPVGAPVHGVILYDDGHWIRVSGIFTGVHGTKDGEPWFIVYVTSWDEGLRDITVSVVEMEIDTSVPMGATAAIIATGAILGLDASKAMILVGDKGRSGHWFRVGHQGGPGVLVAGETQISDAEAIIEWMAQHIVYPVIWRRDLFDVGSLCENVRHAIDCARAGGDR